MEELQRINKMLGVPHGLQNSLSNIRSISSELIKKYDKHVFSDSEMEKVDEMRYTLATLKESGCPLDIELMFCCILKILLRKPKNRCNLGRFGANCIVQCLSRQYVPGAVSGAELGNVVLNACFEASNINYFVQEGILPILLAMTKSNDDLVVASVLGALQGICYSAVGQSSLRFSSDVRT